MKVELKEVSVRDIADGYKNNNEEGVVGYAGKLNIRPKYQREFVYKDVQRNSVIDTVRKNFPLNVMYWSVNADDSFEVLDGQQRTISICDYVTGAFSINEMYFFNLQPDEKEQILNYRLMIYLCQGTDKEKLDWFRTINIAGAELTPQELRNAVYTGPWLSDAKVRFSKHGCPAQSIGAQYVVGSPIRQEFLECAISWISEGKIEKYMSEHQADKNANPLWLHFLKVINWVKATFPNYRKEMKGVDWGMLYKAHGNDQLDPEALEKRVIQLMQDEDVTKKSGIYPYLLTKKEKYLNIRAFPDNIRRQVYESQKHRCPHCDSTKTYEFEEMEADHKKPWHEGGKTIVSNCQMLCLQHNREKSGK